ncbi:MAG: protease inhibitor I42 family protein [Rhizobiaceae bacterium]
MTGRMAQTLVQATFAAALAILGGAGVAANERGAEQLIELPGNPSTGYRWRYDPAASAGADHVAIVELGYQAPESPMPGAPAVFAFRVDCVSAGDARLVFRYLRPWEDVAVETREIETHCP